MIKVQQQVPFPEEVLYLERTTQSAKVYKTLRIGVCGAEIIENLKPQFSMNYSLVLESG